MREIKKNIFLETFPLREPPYESPQPLYYPWRRPQPDGRYFNNTERDWNILKGMADALGIDYKKLDIFITHEHPDHRPGPKITGTWCPVVHEPG